MNTVQNAGRLLPGILPESGGLRMSADAKGFRIDGDYLSFVCLSPLLTLFTEIRNSIDTA